MNGLQSCHHLLTYEKRRKKLCSTRITSSFAFLNRYENHSNCCVHPRLSHSNNKKNEHTECTHIVAPKSYQERNKIFFIVLSLIFVMLCFLSRNERSNAHLNELCCFTFWFTPFSHHFKTCHKKTVVWFQIKFVFCFW